MTDPGPNVALYFDPDGYVEPVHGAPTSTGAGGLMGRHVAGKEFLDAYLAHGRWDALTAVVRGRDRADPLVELCRTHPSSRDKRRRLHLVEESEFAARFTVPDRTAKVLHFPCPPDARFAWLRRAAAPGAFALCGVTHTLCSPAAVGALCDLLAAPFERYDALVCTSRAVVDTVKAVTGAYAEYLADRFGGAPALRPRLELIPLGVSTERFRPATAEERSAARRQLGVADDEVMVLCVGRLSHHAKAHPFPVFRAAQHAAHHSGRKVHLVFAGWAAHPAVAQEYRSGARYFAPAARVTFADGQDPAVRVAVWRAADVLISLPDNVQETFGLVVVEAMASGLPVVGSDWDGYRDLVVPGETGFLVPTRMVRGAVTTAPTRLLFGQLSYDHFLAEMVQTTEVNAGAAGAALTRLVADAPLRKQMGAAARRRAVERFDWANVIRAYEALWAEQERELASHPPASQTGGRFPALEVSFASYPSAWLGDDARVRATPDAPARLPGLLAMPLTNLAAARRCSDLAALTALLRAAAASTTVGALADRLHGAGTDPEAARATVAWLLKYELLVCSDPTP